MNRNKSQRASGRDPSSRRAAEGSRSADRSIAWALTVGKVLPSLFRWGFPALIAFFLREPLIAFAGKVTIANVKVQADLGPGANSSLAGKAFECPQPDLFNGWVIAFLFLMAALAAGAVLYASASRRLRLQVVESFHPVQRQQQLKIDPNRTGSRLTPRGETSPEDL